MTQFCFPHQRVKFVIKKQNNALFLCNIFFIDVLLSEIRALDLKIKKKNYYLNIRVLVTTDLFNNHKRFDDKKCETAH